MIQNVSIAARLTAAFSTVIAIAALLVGIGIWWLSDVTSSLTKIADVRVPILNDLMEISDEVKLQSELLRNGLLFTSEEKVAEASRQTEESVNKASGIYQYLDRIFTEGEGQNLYKAALDLRAEFVPWHQKLMETSAEEGKAAAIVLLENKVGPLQDRYIQALDELKKHKFDLVLETAHEGQKIFQFARFKMIVLLGVMAAIAGVLACWITRSITRPIGQAVEVAERVAAGDLTSRIKVQGNNETSRLLNALRLMNKSLVSIVSTVRMNSDIIGEGSRHIAQSNTDLNQRTEQQADALQETASSMEQVRVIVSKNTDNATHANELTASASSVALDGGEKVRNVVETMREINRSSDQIVDIISVIDVIAFQTNILALNTAVEAARAG